MLPQNIELIILMILLFLYLVLFLIMAFLIINGRIDEGYKWFYVPLVPSVLLVFFEAMRILVLFRGKEQLASGLALTSEYIRLVCGWSWIYFSYKQYSLNKLPLSLRKYSIVSAALIPLNMVILTGAMRLPAVSELLVSLSSLILNSSLFTAAFFALFALKYNNKLYRSTWAGISCALVSLVAYPFIIITELFSFPYEFLDCNWSVWLQMHPYYTALILLTLIPFIIISVLKGSTSADDLKQALSKREQAVAALILEGLSNKDIAESLYISLPTVKTHVSNIFKKEAVHDRKEYIRKKNG